MKGKSPSPLELVKLCCRALDEKKAEDVRVLDVSEQSSITDYLVVATGTSDPHLRALRVELEKAIDASGTRILGMETVQDSGWFVVDLFDVMVHIFSPAVRERYGLENLWKDAIEVSVPKLLAAPKASRPRSPKRVSAARKPVKKRSKK
ncbi:ribosome silencing factor [Opitutus terrae]|uniref:Ribosomal silencing factor RsfS n=1 Tax=Opitutus terrae (strain DSM 11246 / JCM 15787 / PB90-1) TaxID=452637 RepID=B1ZVV9_OPITP|nr:ribosome silencing factor [Opitutus terrae]ACB75045.1 iojap-like protein [Opitutus terrae PB90-1]